MNAPSSAPRGGLPPSLWLHVDSVCDQFEEAWKSGSRPTLEEYVADVTQPERGLLVGELLAVELAYRRNLGEWPASAEYTVRFPECAADVCDAFVKNGESNQGVGAPVAHGAPFPGPHFDAEAAGPETVVCLPPQSQELDTPADLNRVARDCVGDYALLDQIGEGGMGIVYRALQGRLGRIVAVKLIHPDRLQKLSPAKRGRWLQRFRREARLTAQIDHDHVVALYDVDEQDGQPFYAMRYINGQPLSEIVKQGSLDGRRAAAYLEPIARAVHRAHECGILHRDLKPRNILIDARGRPYLTDFGLACWSAEILAQPENEWSPVLDPDDGLTPAGECLGTPPYMSPEQIRDPSQIGPPAEVYSLGATLYEMLTGKPPFQGKTHAETLDMVHREKPVSPRQHNPAVPRDLETITLKCLRKEPSARYATAAALADDLQHFLKGEPLEARRVGWLERAHLWCKRKPGLAAACGIALAASLLMAFLTVSYHLDKDQKDRQVRAKGMLDHALSLCERGEIALGLNWLTRCLEVAPANDRDLQRVVRLNLDAWSRRLGGAPLPQVRHPAKVTSAVLSPDGTTFLTADATGCLRHWNTRTGGLLREFIGHKGSIHRAVFSPDGRLCVTTGYDQSARVWDVATGAEVHRLDSGSRSSRAIFAKSGSMLVTWGGADGGVWLWDLATRKVVQRINVGPFLSAMVASPDAQTLLVQVGVQSATLWDLSSEIALSKYEPPEKASAMILGSDGRSVLTSTVVKTETSNSSGERSILRLWDLSTNALRSKEISLPVAVFHLAMSSDGQRALASGNERTYLCDLATGSFIEPNQPLSGRIRSVSLSALRATILTFSDEQTSRAFEFSLADLDTGGLPHAYTVMGLAVSKDGTTAATSVHVPLGPSQKREAPGGSLQIWDLRNSKPLSDPLACKDWALALAISPDGQTLASGGINGLVELRRLPSGQILCGLQHVLGINKVVFSPDSRLVLCAGSDKLARIWDVATGTEVFQLNHSSSVKVAAFSPDGKRIVTGSQDGTVCLWNAHAGTLLEAQRAHEGVAHCVTFSPDGRTFVSAGRDCVVYIWDTALATRLHTCEGHSGAIHCVVFTQDGKRLLTGSADGTVRIWDPTKGEQVGAPLAHDSSVCMTALSPDGTMLLTGCTGQVGRLWDLATGRPIGPPLKHNGAVRDSAFSADSQGFWTTGNGNQVRFWRIPGILRGDPKRITLWGQVATRMELDAGGVSRPLDEAAWNQRRAELGEGGLP